MRLTWASLITIFAFSWGLTSSHASETLDIPPQNIELQDYQYPYPVGFLTLNQQQQKLSMAYMDINPDNSNGKNVLLLHGKNFNGAYWQSTIESLAQAGYRIIVPDQIGFGKSTKPDHYQYSFQQLAENTRALLKSLNVETVAVVGHSMGGMLATRFALMFPEMAHQLILVNPIGLEDYRRQAPYVSIDQWNEKEKGKNYISIRNYQQKNYYDGQWNEDFARWAKLAASWNDDPQYEKVAWNSALTYDMIYSQPVVYEFPDLTQPTLLIIGTRDRTALGKNLVSKSQQEKMGRYDLLGKATQKSIPHAQLVELDHVGHLPHIEAFARYIQPLQNFLAENQP